MPKPKRLAITIAGAVSLGSFEAGVLYEILEALRQHNAHPATTDTDRIEIDVLTGASAGGMTAAIAAQKLVFDGAALEGAETNAFYLPWVKRVSLDGLLDQQEDEKAGGALLSSEKVRAIAREFLLDRYAHGKPAARRHPAAASCVKLGLALANLDGVDYRRTLATRSEHFTYTRFQDEFYLDVDSEVRAHDTAGYWQDACEAAISTGAFPFAFRPVALERTRQNYTPRRPVPGDILAPWPGDATSAQFTYTDGGTFQNEPLGMAKNLVDTIDGHFDNDSRFYLFVAPGEKSGKKPPEPSTPGEKPPKPTPIRTLIGRLVGAIFQQARFHDWIRAEELNDQIDILNDRAKGLAESIRAGAIDPDTELQPAAAHLLPLLFDHRADGSSEKIAEARIRLAHQYADECKIVRDACQAHGHPPGWEATYIDSLLVLETAAHLARYDEMVIYGVTATDAELASGPICAFGGFFDLSYRQHDYDLGRNKARGLLRQLAVAPAGRSPSLAPIRCVVPPDETIDKTLNGLTYDGLDSKALQRFQDAAFKRVDQLLTEFDVPGYVRWPILKFWIEPKLRDLMNPKLKPKPQASPQ